MKFSDVISDFKDNIDKVICLFYKEKSLDLIKIN